MSGLAVLVETVYATRSTALANQLALPQVAPGAVQDCDFLLEYVGEMLVLHSLKPEKQTIFVDFASAGLLWRQRQTLLGEMVVRAAGGKKALGASILDATAGLGQDSFILASAGFNVHMNEASPIVHALLQDGLARLRQSGDAALQATASRLTLTLGDSRPLLSDHPFDIVYLDPMFPERRKTAKVKKNMQVLQQLLGHDGETEGLFAAALRSAKKRVVVKRPRLSPWLEERKPSLDIIGKSSRFDIYLRG